MRVTHRRASQPAGSGYDIDACDSASLSQIAAAIRESYQVPVPVNSGRYDVPIPRAPHPTRSLHWQHIWPLLDGMRGKILGPSAYPVFA